MNKKNNLSQSAKVSLDKPIKMPRPYISWSQLSLFERNPIKYASIYLYGDKRTNPRMELGKAVAEMLEKDEENTDKNLEFYRVFLPQYPHKEFDVKAMLGDILLFGKLDGFDDRCSACGQNWLDMVEQNGTCKICKGKSSTIFEIKTGAKWNQKMADETGQLSFYALLIYLAYGIKPENIKIKLYWMPTIIDEIEGLKLTGDLKVFETKRTMIDLVDMMGRIRRAWNGIASLCRSEGAAIGFND